jgi:hypothetical protein
MEIVLVIQKSKTMSNYLKMCLLPGTIPSVCLPNVKSARIPMPVPFPEDKPIWRIIIHYSQSEIAE